MEERDYNEVYDNGINLLDVFVHTGTYKVFFRKESRDTRTESIPYLTGFRGVPI